MNSIEEAIMQPVSLRRTQAQVQVNGFIRSVYNWMAFGFGFTGLEAFYVSNNESLQRIVFGKRRDYWRSNPASGFYQPVSDAAENIGFQKGIGSELKKG